MLVLSRLPSQSLLVGDGIVVTILEVHGDKVKVGIDAPQSVRVKRHEVADLDADGFPGIHGADLAKVAGEAPR